MSSSLQFPSKEILLKNLSCAQELLPYQKYTDLVSKVTEAAAAQFGNKVVDTCGAKVACGLLVLNVKCGPTGYDHLENSPQYPLSEEEWTALAKHLFEALGAVKDKPKSL